MPTRRPIPEVDTKEYAKPGAIEIKASPEQNGVVIELHHCTAFLNEKESLQVCLSLLKACLTMWGNTFVRKFLTHMESL